MATSGTGATSIPDQKIAEYTSYDACKDNDLKPGQVRLLSVDNPVVLPVDTDIRILTTAGDVIHSWAVPAFGVKKDAVPGRTNETWVRIDKPGVYYGQCSRAVRHRPRLHADRGARGQPRGFRQVGRREGRAEPGRKAEASDHDLGRGAGAHQAGPGGQ